MRTPLLALCAVVALVEATDRLPAADRIAPPAWTRRVPEFDVRYHAFRRLSREGGPFDVVAVGSSLAVADVNPDELAIGIGRRSGRRPTVFNFGLPGASNRVVEALVGILRAERRPPQLFLLATGPTTLSEFFGERLGQIVREEPWFRHRSGLMDAEGWLLERWSGLRRWNGLSRDRELWRRTEEPMGRLGDRQITPSRSAARDRRGGEELEGGGVQDDDPPGPVNVDALHETLLSIGSRNAVVAVAPLRPEAGRPTHSGLQAALEETVRDAGVHLVPAPPEELLPPGVFRDAGHLGVDGARIYSRWLGERLAELAVAGTIDLPVAGSR